MTRTASDTLLTTGYVVAGLAGALAAARLSLGSNMLQMRQFMSFPVIGLLAALVYASVRLRGPGTVMLVLLLLYLTEVALNPPLRPSAVVGAAFFTIPVGLALVSSSYLFRVLHRVPIGRFIVMGAVVAAGYAGMVAVFLVFMRQKPAAFLVMDQAVIGAKVGAAVGLGFELVDLLARLFQRNRPAEVRSTDA